MHLRRNALDHAPRKHDDNWLQELRWFNDRRDLACWPDKWQDTYPKLTHWI